MKMNISSHISSDEIILTNGIVKVIYYPKIGAYSVYGKNGKIEHVLPAILAVSNSKSTKVINKEKTLSVGTRAHKILHKLDVFTPETVQDESIYKSIVSEQPFSDDIGSGLILKINVKFVSPSTNGIFIGYFIAKIQSYANDPDGIVLIQLEISEIKEFSSPPLIHSYAPMFACNKSSWEPHSGYEINPRNITFLRNGYQSWSICELLDWNDRAKITPSSIGKINMQNQDMTIRARYISEMITAVTDTETNKSLILGFVTNSHQFTRILMERMGNNNTFQFLIALSQVDNIAFNFCSLENLKSEELLISFSSNKTGVKFLQKWAEITGTKMKSRILQVKDKKIMLNEKSRVLSGWCSWYYYYTKVREIDMEENIDFLSKNSEYPLDIVQLDDGYQVMVGDFTSINEKFPKGLKSLVDLIHDKNFIAGLWIAPFFAQDKSALFKTHPDWFLKDRKGKLIKPSYNWGSFLYALDLSKTEVLAHIKSLVTTIVKEWGFDYIKIDFIYASEAIQAVYSDPTFTRAQILRRGVQAIRDAMGDAILLGCGAPLGPCIGLVDVMRIGCDTSAVWINKGKIGELAHKLANVEIPALQPALISALQRAYMHNSLWFNDPDCVMIREDNSKLTLSEVITQITIFGLSGGQVFFSDNLPLLPEDRLYYMNLIIPPYKEGAIAIDQLRNNPPTLFGLDTMPAVGRRILLALINWENEEIEESIVIQDILESLGAADIDCDSFFIFDFWSEKEFKLLGKFSREERIHIYNIRPHGCRYLSIIPTWEFDENQPIFLSSNLHITQGCKEVSKFDYNVTEKILSIEFNIKGDRSGEITLLTPNKLKVKEGLPPDTKILDTDHGTYLEIPIDLPSNNRLKISFV